MRELKHRSHPEFYVTFEHGADHNGEPLYATHDCRTELTAKRVAASVRESGKFAAAYRRTDPVRHEVPNDGVWWTAWEGDDELIDDGSVA